MWDCILCMGDVNFWQRAQHRVCKVAIMHMQTHSLRQVCSQPKASVLFGTVEGEMMPIQQHTAICSEPIHSSVHWSESTSIQTSLNVLYSSLTCLSTFATIYNPQPAPNYDIIPTRQKKDKRVTFTSSVIQNIDSDEEYCNWIMFSCMMRTCGKFIKMASCKYVDIEHISKQMQYIFSAY